MQENAKQKACRYIKDTEMLKSVRLVIAGVSGGPDSMAMLDILRKLKEECGQTFDIRVVHVNHGIRGEEALRDQKTVESACADWNIPCAVYMYDVPGLAKEWKTGTEEAGRKVRRIAFEEEKKKAGVPEEQIRVALAHNRNDMAETMLHHLARGTGIRGMCSLKPVNGGIIRPLLCLERREIVNYVKENAIPYETDSSNLEDEYTRNRIRRHVLPVLENEVNPRAVAHMAEASEIFGQAEAYFAGIARKQAEEYRIRDTDYILPVKFFMQEEIIQLYVIREILEKCAGHQSDLTSGHVKQIRDLSEAQTGRRIMLPYEVEAARRYEGVEIRKKTASRAEEQGLPQIQKEAELALPSVGEVKWQQSTLKMRIFSYNGEKILEKKYTKWFDCDKINCELSVRTRRSGDFMVVNQSGGHKKLTRCMIDDKIPGECRAQIPLVADGNEILWIIGGRINERYKITSRTGRVLEITYQGGNVQ